MKKKFKPGKIKRHKFRQKLGLSSGFGKPWSAPFILFRVEFSWENEDGTEENYQTHWIECRKFKGEERNLLLAHYAQSSEDWGKKETLESTFVCIHCANYLVANKEGKKINQAFIFPTTKEGNETIRTPIYQIKWTPELARNSVFNASLTIVLNNSVWHRKID